MYLPECLQMGGSFSASPAFSSCALAATLWLCFFPAEVRAATNTVTTLADSGSGSLRQTIVDSVPGDTITFAISGGWLKLDQELAVDKDLNILGPGQTNLTISGNHASRLFLIRSNITVLISGFTLRDGQSSNGVNGVVLSGGSLTAGTAGAPGGRDPHGGNIDCE